MVSAPICAHRQRDGYPPKFARLGFPNDWPIWGGDNIADRLHVSGIRHIFGVRRMKSLPAAGVAPDGVAAGSRRLPGWLLGTSGKEQKESDKHDKDRLIFSEFCRFSPSDIPLDPPDAFA